MASEFFGEDGRSGLKRGGDDLAADRATKYTIVGLDISREELEEQFADDAIALEMISRAVDRADRFDQTSQDYILFRDAGGVETNYAPIDFVCIGSTTEGNAYNLVLDGRQRVMARRYWDDVASQESPRHPGRTLRGVPYKPKKLGGSGLAAARIKIASRIRVAPTLATLAGDVAEMRGLGVEPAEVARLMALQGGVQEETELWEWSELLPELCEKARELANDFKLSLGKAKKLAKLRKAEQTEILSGNALPKKAEPKAKRQPLGAGPLAMLAADVGLAKHAGILHGLRLAAGDVTVLEEVPELREAMLRAGWDTAAARFKAGRKAAK